MADFPLAMTPAEAEVFRRRVGAARCYLEYGCGGSTVEAVKLCRGALRSIDTDATWISRLRENTQVAEAVSSGRLIFQHIDVGAIGAWGTPATEQKIRNWPLYPVGPFLTHDLEFDLILVDGRFRLATLYACAVLARDDVTIICHDYARRHQYSGAEKYFDTIESADTLVVLKKRPRVNLRALHLDLMQSLFDYR